MDTPISDGARWNGYKEAFKTFVIDDLKKAISGELEIGVITLTVAAIDTLAGCYAGRPTTHAEFKCFVRRFMPQYDEKALYECVRCGLIHGSSMNPIMESKRRDEPPMLASQVKGFFLTRDRGEYHLTEVPDKEGFLYLNRVSFVEDFFTAQEEYFNEVASNQETFRRAVARVKQTGFLVVREQDAQKSDWLKPQSNPPTSITGAWGRGGYSDVG